MDQGAYEIEKGQGGQSVREDVMAQAMTIAGQPPVPVLRSLICPYCGSVTPDTGKCSACTGRFDPLSRQATQNQMGPWSIRDDRQPHRPGCTYETIAKLIQQGAITGETVLRGPTTRQFWTLARQTPAIAHLLGKCHSCQTAVQADAFACPVCHAAFTAERDRQHLGLGPSRPLPGQGLPEVLAMRAEPASGGAGGVTSLPIGSQGSEARAEHAPIAMGSSDRQQVEDAARLARRWKAAWESSRRHAWVVMGLSMMIALASLAYALFGSQAESDPGATGAEQVGLTSVEMITFT